MARRAIHICAVALCSLLVLAHQAQGAHQGHRSLKMDEGDSILAFPYLYCGRSSPSPWSLSYVGTTPQTVGNEVCFKIVRAPGGPCATDSTSGCCNMDVDKVIFSIQSSCAASAIMAATVDGEPNGWDIVQPQAGKTSLRLLGVNRTAQNAEGTNVCLTLWSPCDDLQRLCTDSLGGVACKYAITNSGILTGEGEACCPVGEFPAPPPLLKASGTASETEEPAVPTTPEPMPKLCGIKTSVHGPSSTPFDQMDCYSLVAYMQDFYLTDIKVIIPFLCAASNDTSMVVTGTLGSADSEAKFFSAFESAWKQNVLVERYGLQCGASINVTSSCGMTSTFDVPCAVPSPAPSPNMLQAAASSTDGVVVGTTKPSPAGSPPVASPVTTARGAPSPAVPSPTASPTPSPQASPAVPSPKASPAPSPKASPAPSPEASPVPSPKASPVPSPQPSPTPSPAPSPTTDSTDCSLQIYIEDAQKDFVGSQCAAFSGFVKNVFLVNLMEPPRIICEMVYPVSRTNTKATFYQGMLATVRVPTDSTSDIIKAVSNQQVADLLFKLAGVPCSNSSSSPQSKLVVEGQCIQRQVMNPSQCGTTHAPPAKPTTPASTVCPIVVQLQAASQPNSNNTCMLLAWLTAGLYMQDVPQPLGAWNCLYHSTESIVVSAVLPDIAASVKFMSAFANSSRAAILLDGMKATQCTDNIKAVSACGPTVRFNVSCPAPPASPRPPIRPPQPPRPSPPLSTGCSITLQATVGKPSIAGPVFNDSQCMQLASVANEYLLGWTSWTTWQGQDLQEPFVCSARYGQVATVTAQFRVSSLAATFTSNLNNVTKAELIVQKLGLGCGDSLAAYGSCMSPPFPTFDSTSGVPGLKCTSPQLPSPRLSPVVKPSPAAAAPSPKPSPRASPSPRAAASPSPKPASPAGSPTVARASPSPRAVDRGAPVVVPSPHVVEKGSPVVKAQPSPRAVAQGAPDQSPSPVVPAASPVPSPVPSPMPSPSPAYPVIPDSTAPAVYPPSLDKRGPPTRGACVVGITVRSETPNKWPLEQQCDFVAKFSTELYLGSLSQYTFLSSTPTLRCKSYDAMAITVEATLQGVELCHEFREKFSDLGSALLVATILDLGCGDTLVGYAPVLGADMQFGSNVFCEQPGPPARKTPASKKPIPSSCPITVQMTRSTPTVFTKVQCAQFASAANILWLKQYGRSSTFSSVSKINSTGPFVCESSSFQSLTITTTLVGEGTNDAFLTAFKSTSTAKLVSIIFSLDCDDVLSAKSKCGGTVRFDKSKLCNPIAPPSPPPAPPAFSPPAPPPSEVKCTIVTQLYQPKLPASGGGWYSSFDCEHLAQYVNIMYTDGLNPSTTTSRKGIEGISKLFKCFFFSNQSMMVMGTVKGLSASARFLDNFKDANAAQVAGVAFELQCGAYLHSSSSCNGDVIHMQTYCPVNSPSLPAAAAAAADVSPPALPAASPVVVDKAPFNKSAGCIGGTDSSPWRVTVLTKEEGVTGASGHKGTKVCFGVSVSLEATSTCNKECCSMAVSSFELGADAMCEGAIQDGTFNGAPTTWKFDKAAGRLAFPEIDLQYASGVSGGAQLCVLLDERSKCTDLPTLCGGSSCSYFLTSVKDSSCCPDGSISASPLLQ